MYRVMATMLHKDYDPCYTYSYDTFNDPVEAQEWIKSVEGEDFAQSVMVAIDVLEYLEGYWLESLTVNEKSNTLGVEPTVIWAD